MIRRLVLLREVPKDAIYIYKATKAVVRNKPLFQARNPLLLPGEASLGIIHCCYLGRTALASSTVVRNREPLFLGQPWHHPLLLPGEDSLGILQCC